MTNKPEIVRHVMNGKMLRILGLRNSRPFYKDVLIMS
jgi:hypothetical protein